MHTGVPAPTEQGPIDIHQGQQLAQDPGEDRQVLLLEEQLTATQLQLEQAQEQEAQAKEFGAKMVRYRRSLEAERLISRKEQEDLPTVLRRFRLRHQEEMATIWGIADWAYEERRQTMENVNITREQVEKLKRKQEKWAAGIDFVPP